MKYVQSEENICDYSSWHPYIDLLKFKELIHYVSFVADAATPNTLAIDIITKFTKNDQVLHQITKLALQNNCYKLNIPLILLEYVSFKHFLKTDTELVLNDY